MRQAGSWSQEPVKYFLTLRFSREGGEVEGGRGKDSTVKWESSQEFLIEELCD